MSRECKLKYSIPLMSAFTNAKHLARRLLRIMLGDRLFTRYMSIRSRNCQVDWLKRRGVFDLNQRLIEAVGTTVVSGPFKGLRYPRQALLERHAGPKLLGTYERELHRILISRSWTDYEHVVDIGCAEGYYAVGIAAIYGCRVYGFDTEPDERAFCREMAKMNGVANQVILSDWADSFGIAELCSSKRCFVMSDCEGYEVELFSGSVANTLLQSDVLIEIHEASPGEVSNLLCDRFAPTHETEIIAVEPRRLVDYPDFSHLGNDGERAITEHRNKEQTWLWCTPRNVG